MQDKRNIRERYMDISRLIFFKNHYQSAVDNRESSSQFEVSVWSGSMRSLNSTITTDSTMSKCNSQIMGNGIATKPKKKSLFRKLSFSFIRSSSTTSENTKKNDVQKNEEDV